MYKTFLAFLLFFVLLLPSWAQDDGPDRNVLYRNERSGNLYVHSAGGFGVGFRRSKHFTGLSKGLMEIECNNFKSPKETKNFDAQFLAGANSVVFGKLNSVLLFRGGVGYKNVIARRVEKKNIEIRYVAIVGITAAFAKPVYLYVTDTSGKSSKVLEKYNPEIHSRNDIVGKADFSNGLGETKIVPAGYLKLGLYFDYSERYDAVRAFEVGGVMDAYPKALKLMAFSSNNNLLFSLYIRMIWGRKWL